AAGSPLPWGQADLEPTGHAVEARVYAEDPERDFLPTGGNVLRLGRPTVEGVRVDPGVMVGEIIGSHYDPMIAKVITHGCTRRQAIRRLVAALAQLSVAGVTTNLEHLQSLLAHPAVLAGDLDTDLVERLHRERAPLVPPTVAFAVAALASLDGS